jgi:hypothetical protein
VDLVRCDACGFHVKHEHGRGELFTFGLKYEWGLEEIDVHADNARVAKETAIALAIAVYDPGWELIEMPAGGTGGLVYHL